MLADYPFTPNTSVNDPDVAYIGQIVPFVPATKRIAPWVRIVVVPRGRAWLLPGPPTVRSATKVASFSISSSNPGTIRICRPVEI